MRYTVLYSTLAYADTSHRREEEEKRAGGKRQKKKKKRNSSSSKPEEIRNGDWIETFLEEGRNTNKRKAE
jgi:hypothetical protein